MRNTTNIIEFAIEKFIALNNANERDAFFHMTRRDVSIMQHTSFANTLIAHVATYDANDVVLIVTFDTYTHEIENVIVRVDDACDVAYVH